MIEANRVLEYTVYMLIASSIVYLLINLPREKAPQKTISIPLYKVTALIKKLERIIFRVISISLFKFREEYVVFISTDRHLTNSMDILKKLISKYAKEIEDLRSVLILKEENVSKGSGWDLSIIFIKSGGGISESVTEGLKILIIGEEDFAKMFQNLKREDKSNNIVLYGEEFLDNLIASKQTLRGNTLSAKV